MTGPSKRNDKGRVRNASDDREELPLNTLDNMTQPLRGLKQVFIFEYNPEASFSYDECKGNLGGNIWVGAAVCWIDDQGSLAEEREVEAENQEEEGEEAGLDEEGKVWMGKLGGAGSLLHDARRRQPAVKTLSHRK
eukprot:489746-Hanusia_phi.AAC.2